jgi:ceramide glucosyltransferase
MTILHAVAGGAGVLFWVGALFAALCLVANLYSVFGVIAASEFFSEEVAARADFHPPISILKPVRGLDPDAYRNLASFCRQDYPEYEILFALESEEDPAAAVVRQVLRDHPNVDARIVFRSTPTSGSPKVASLVRAGQASRHPLLLVSDADIRVGPGHLRAMAAPLRDSEVGVVTCLYRSVGTGFVGRLDALGLTAEFQREVLVARKVEGISFAMGSGILIRESVLQAIGGFEAVADALSDDFLLGNLPSRRGYRVEFGRDVVDHVLGTKTLRDLVRHQIRWNRGIRASRPAGYAGLVVAHAPAISLLLLLTEPWNPFAWAAFAATCAVSMTAAWIVAGRLLDDPETRRSLWMVPVRDLLSFGLWIGGFVGNEVEWRGRRFRLGRGGTLTLQEDAAGEISTKRAT